MKHVYTALRDTINGGQLEPLTLGVISILKDSVILELPISLC